MHVLAHVYDASLAQDWSHVHLCCLYKTIPSISFWFSLYGFQDFEKKNVISVNARIALQCRPTVAVISKSWGREGELKLTGKLTIFLAPITEFKFRHLLSIVGIMCLWLKSIANNCGYFTYFKKDPHILFH